MSGPSPPFVLSLTPPFREQLRRLTEVARDGGWWQELQRAVTLIERQLKHDPIGWGEPYRKLRGMNGVWYGKVVHPPGVWVDYVVHNVASVVFAANFELIEPGTSTGE